MDKEGGERKRGRSAGPSIGKGTQGMNDDDGLKVKVIVLICDTRKVDAESTLLKSCAKEEGCIESYMPGSQNDFAFVKFDLDSARRRFLNKIHSEELVVMHEQQKMRFSRCRTIEQKDKTNYVDKCSAWSSRRCRRNILT